MAYLIYSWHHQIFIKKGYRRGDDCFIPCTEDGGKQHTKCPIHNMELRHDKIICDSVSEIPTALRILTDYMGYSTKLAKSVFDGWASRIRQWTKEEEKYKAMPKPESKKDKESVKLLNYIGELVFIPKEREDLKLVQALIDCGYYLERSETTRRLHQQSISYYATKEPTAEQIRVTYGIFELSDKEV